MGIYDNRRRHSNKKRQKIVNDFMVIPIHILGLVNKFIVRYELTEELYIMCTVFHSKMRKMDLQVIKKVCVIRLVHFNFALYIQFWFHIGWSSQPTKERAKKIQ